MVAIDLHTHSIGSPDGSLTAADYASALKAGLEYIAITDHDSIAQAQAIQKELGGRVIIGQEVTTTQGELIGLFLTERVTPGKSALQTAKAIHAQGGLVYVPHPFETVRKGIPRSVLDTITQHVDIVETHNGRAVFQNKGPLAATWARLNNKVVCASSDAHGRLGLGATLTTIDQPPTAKNLVAQLADGQLTLKRPPIYSLLYPKLNRFRGTIRRKS